MSGFVIRYRKKDLPKYIIWAELFLVCFNGFFADVFGMPSSLKYSMDLFNVVLGINIFIKLNRQSKIETNIRRIELLIGLFIFFSFILWLPTAGNPVLFLWGARNTFRFLIFFLACILFLDDESIDQMLKKINSLIIVNFLLCAYEFVVLGHHGDSIGGGFGTHSGCNAPLNVLLVIVTIYNAIKYTQRENSLLKTIVYIGLCAVISGMAELKVYIVEVVMIIIIVGAFSKGFIKKFVLAAVGMTFVFVSIHMIETFIPGWEGFFTIKNMYQTVSSTNGYNNQGDLNRLTAISEINRLFFRKSINWTGLGLGNCEYSDTFLFLNSTFSLRYGYLHYAWFSVAKIYLELGWFGVAASISIWGYTLLTALKKLKSKPLYRVAAVSMSVMAIFFFYYNFTMNLDAAYLVYTVLAIAYTSLKPCDKGGRVQCLSH